jgi:hypothetical protein
LHRPRPGATRCFGIHLQRQVQLDAITGLQQPITGAGLTEYPR